MRHRFDVRVGPVAYRIGSAWEEPVNVLRRLYSKYDLCPQVPHFTVRLAPAKPWRRFVRPSIALAGDAFLPEALPLSLRHGLLAAEMGMNVQLALGERRFLLLHAASVVRDRRALILTGESGSGKSTLSALLGERGWRFTGDEFALIAPGTGALHAFPRPISLKNEAIGALVGEIGEARFGPLLEGTPKGNVRHLMPNADAIEGMNETATAALIVFPRFGHERAVRPVAESEAFVRLTQASTNYTALGERGFDALTRLVTQTRAVAIDYPDSIGGCALIDELWAAL